MCLVGDVLGGEAVVVMGDKVRIGEVSVVVALKSCFIYTISG